LTTSVSAAAVFDPLPVPAPSGQVPAPPGPAPRRRVREVRPAWSVPARIGIALLSALLYGWELSRVGMGNSFYAAAVKSGTESWKAFFFGSLDPGSFITVDKPPASLWLMELSGWIFGFSSLSMLVPEALCGVASVLIVYRLVRRWMGERTAVLASIGFALTPVAVLMFRYNNPDAFLTLLLLLAAWALWSALETASTLKLVVCGVLVGTAFTTKELQAFIVLPVLGLVYLWAGPPKLGRRIVQLLWAGLATAVSSLWWVAAVELWPAASRPYIGGSTDNSEWNLIFGYNGFSRVFGSGGGSSGVRSPGGGSPFAGSPGILRMFNDIMGGQISWLLPLALVGLVAGIWWSRHGARTDLVRAGFVLWGGWMLIHLLVFSQARGILHPYYTVVLAPAVAAVAAGGVVALWRLGRANRLLSWLLPAAVLVSAAWAATLLDRTPTYDHWLVPAALVGGVAAALALQLAQLRLLGSVRSAVLVGVAGTVACAVLLAGPAAYALSTVGMAESGGDPTAGPTVAAGTSLGGGFAAFGPGGSGRAGGVRFAPAGGSGGTRSGPGGGSGSTSPTALDRYLEAHRGSAEYLVAVDGAQSAEGIILATGKPVMAMGGFTGTDHAPTVAEFKKLVASGKVHYVLVGGSGGSGGFGGPGASGGSVGARSSGVPGGSGGFPTSGGVTAPSGVVPGGAGGSGSGSTVGAVLRWVEEHGTKVSSSAYGGGSDGGTLYFVTSAAASS
jgi:4-amino-4-deoxy-L-arabinose transferase-like glycosyltransferase